MRRILLVLSLLSLTSIVFAQQNGDNFPPPKVAPVITATKASGEIDIDGKLSEQDWERATPITNFFRTEPRQGGAYLYNTSVRILFDEKNLYFGVFCTDSLGKKGIRVQDLRRDFSWGENDIIGFQLDPQNLKQYCVLLSQQTSPLAGNSVPEQA